MATIRPKSEAMVRAGSLGGKASAAKLTPEQRSIRSSINGNKTLQRYGIGFYRAIAQLRKAVG